MTMTTVRVTTLANLSLVAACALLIAALTPQAVLAAAAEQPETVCIQCHSTLPDQLGAPVNLWRKSIHAENGISCNSCHGGDPRIADQAMSPAHGFLGAPKDPDVPAFCGRCHPGVLKDYLASKHGKALGKGGPTCFTCHSNHLVLKASLDLINEKTCTQCHDFERARTIKAAMMQTEGYVLSIDRRITDYQNRGIDVERLAKSLFSVRNRFHTLFHDVDVTRVKSESAQINADLGKIDQELKGIESVMHQRKLAGGIVVAFLLGLAGLLHLLKKTFD